MNVRGDVKVNVQEQEQEQEQEHGTDSADGPTRYTLLEHRCERDRLVALRRADDEKPEGVERTGRIRRAFSLRAGIRALIVPAPGRLRPLDGLRALSILWVVAFHTAWFSWTFQPSIYFSLLHAGWLLPIWRGDFGVDVFFVLSGFLIAGMLIDERARTGSVRLGSFYLRRLMRLWPALATVAVIELVRSADHAATAWATLLYVSNFVPVVRTFMVWTWSLSIEEQFYLLCPWLLAAIAPRTPQVRFMALAVVALVLVGVGAGVAINGPFFAFDAEIAINRPFDAWARAYDTLYSKPWMRAGPLVAGVSAAFVHRTPKVMTALAKSSVGAPLGFVSAVGLAAAATHWQSFFGASRGLEIAYLASYRVTFGCAVAYILLVAVSDHPLARLLSRPLSSRLFHPIARLAYAAYLVNPIVALWTHRTFSARVMTGGEAMALLLPLDAVLTFALAAVLHSCVERPLMELRPR